MKFLPALRSSALAIVAACAMFATGSQAFGIGFVLGETKDELQLKYDVSVYDNSTGRVTVVFTLTDEGRLKPLDEVQLAIPAATKNEDGSSWMDLVVSLDMRETDGGSRIARVHILKEFAQRAEIRLNTHAMDDKTDPMTRLHHVIPIAEYFESAATKDVKPAAPRTELSAPPASEEQPR